MNVEMIEALVVKEGEVLVIRVDEDTFMQDDKLTEFAQSLDETLLKGRYIIFSGQVEFTKVKL